MERKKRTYISFDWAMKRLLRDKADFSVLEGFLNALFDRQVKVKDLLEESTLKRIISIKIDAEGIFESSLAPVQKSTNKEDFGRKGLFGAD